MKNAKRKISESERNLNRLRGAVGQKNNTHLLRTALAACKESSPTDQFEYIYVVASASSQFPLAYAAGRKITNNALLNYEKSMGVASFSREVHWASVSCAYSASLLNSFLPRRKDFFAEISDGNFSRASETLEWIEENCGKSLWGIENKILLLSLSAGFEAQKKFSQQIVSENPRTNVAFYSNYISERNEARVNFSAFKERIESRSASWGISKDHLAEIKFRLIDIINDEEHSFSGVLSRQNANSPIDLYETLLALIRRAGNQSWFNPKSIEKSFEYLAELEDYRLAKLRDFLFHTAKSVCASAIQRPVNYVELYLAGNYGSALDAAAKTLSDDPQDIEACMYLAKCCAIMKAPPPVLKWPSNTIFGDTIQLLTGSSGGADAADNLKKISLNLRNSDASSHISAFLEERMFNGLLKRAQLDLSSSLYLKSADLKLCLTDSLQEHSLPYTFQRRFETLARGLVADKKLSDLNLSVENHHVAILYGALTTGDTEAALVQAAKLSESQHNVFQIEARYLVPHLLAHRLQTEEAVYSSVEAYLKQPEFLPFTPLIRIIKHRGFRDLKGLKNTPHLSIAFEVYVNETDAVDKEVSLKVAWKNYLASQAVLRPSEIKLDPRLSDFSAKIYFLHQVCTQQTMELGGVFDSQLALDRERLSICVSLAIRDPENRNVYDAEIVELTRRINLEEGATFLESSRVYVDELGVASWAKRNVEPEFLRYLDFQKAGFFKSIKELEESLRTILTQSKNKQSAIQSYLDEYDVTAESLLEGVLKSIASAFLSLPRYGLDAFLSSRIRHGSFVGYLRSPFEVKNLITKKDSSSRKYQDNDELLDRWGIESREMRRQANIHLARFSEKIDSILDEMVARHLHVQSKLRPDGMIAFGAQGVKPEIIFKRWVISLKATMTDDATLDNLCEFCFTNFFWPAVRISLQNLQSFLKGEFRVKLIDALDDLVNSLNYSMHESRRSFMLADSHFAKTEIQAAVDRVALWFDTQTSTHDRISITLRDAIEVGLLSTKNARPHFKPDVEWKIKESANFRLNLNAIRQINEISFLVFENASKHSGFEESFSKSTFPQKIEVAAALLSNGLEIVVTSQISDIKNLQEVESGIKNAKAKIAAQDFDGITQAAKGTGLVRLAISTSNHDTAQHGSTPLDNSVDFGLTDGRNFFVRILLAKALYESHLTA